MECFSGRHGSVFWSWDFADLCLMTIAGGIGRTLPYLISNFYTGTAIAAGIARTRCHTPFQIVAF